MELKVEQGGGEQSWQFNRNPSQQELGDVQGCGWEGGACWHQCMGRGLMWVADTFQEVKDTRRPSDASKALVGMLVHKCAILESINEVLVAILFIIAAA